MDPIVLLVFAFVYLGMIVGRVHGLALDRTGIALLGAIALLATGRVGLHAAWQSVDDSTIALLMGLMVVSAQFRLGGFYTRVAHGLAGLTASPPVVLGLLIGAAGVLSALLANDIVCLAVTPVLVEGCARRGLNPVPYLLGLACAANIGSAATLIGNPQNMLIGQMLGLHFTTYLLQGGVPAVLGLGVAWAIVCGLYRGRWHVETPVPEVHAAAFDAWQTAKGGVVLGGVVVVFLLTSWPRDVVALTAAGVLLTSRRMASRPMLAAVDWHLLVLFAGLFVVNRAVQECSLLESAAGWLSAGGIDVHRPGWLFIVTAVLSNLVSNVPATMLLLPFATHPLAGPVLALSSTLAGNLFIVGSIANIIVVEQAAALGVRITWAEHARVGVPVTLATLSGAALWLWVLCAAGA
ncbi:MAG: anion transporter [Candidatus Brocadiaceae bacterium]|nr:anion transporter [Candidatus Brocadiaceae bacterium]